MNRGVLLTELVDAAALLVFTGVGIAMHGAGFGAGPILRNIVPFLGVWYVLAPVTHVYRRLDWRSLLIHWAVVLPIAVIGRQLWVGRLFSRATVVFFVASLVLTLALLIAGRLILWLGRRVWAREATAGR